ncbi:MAG: hypothetical protein ACXV5H_05990 [Halobacteriota archaeon]
MSNEKICQNCGAKNQPFAALCLNCGTSFVTSPETTQAPPSQPPLEKSLDSEPPYEAPLETAPRFKKRYLILGVLAVLSLFIVVGAISASLQTANKSIATPSIESLPTSITPSPTVSPSVTVTATTNTTGSPSSAQPSLPDYTGRLNTVSLGAGLSTVSPFEKITINGRTAYTGTLVKNGQTYNTQVYPTSNYSEALILKDQLVRSFQSQGYVAYNPGSTGDANLNIWYGLSGNALVSVTAVPSSQIDTPLVLVMTPTS